MRHSVVYIHGFNSSPASFKAGLLKRALLPVSGEVAFLAPELPPSPKEAIRLLDDITGRNPGAVYIGSSLGGYYATWLAERHASRAVLINPAVRAYDVLAAAVGPQRNLHTGTGYEFTAGHLRELRELEVERITPERYLLLVATGDEVLDYRRAVERYAGAKQLVVSGSDHGFSDFENYIDQVTAFVLE